MAWNRNIGCDYRYTVRLDLEPIISEIIRRLPGDEDEWEIDGDELNIYMTDRAMADVWHCRQTLESPEENEIDLKRAADEVDINGAIIEALHSIDKLTCAFEIDEESIVLDENEPDPDRAYDEWRDRQFEDD